MKEKDSLKVKKRRKKSKKNLSEKQQMLKSLNEGLVMLKQQRKKLDAKKLLDAQMRNFETPEERYARKHEQISLFSPNSEIRLKKIEE